MTIFVVVNFRMKVQAVFVRRWEAEKYAEKHMGGMVLETKISDDNTLAILKGIANAKV